MLSTMLSVMMSTITDLRIMTALVLALGIMMLVHTLYLSKRFKREVDYHALHNKICKHKNVTHTRHHECQHLQHYKNLSYVTDFYKSMIVLVVVLITALLVCLLVS